MKVKLLRKFRKRFVFIDDRGFSEMLDKETGKLYSPEWRYCRSPKSVKDHLIDVAIELLTGQSANYRSVIKGQRKRDNQHKHRVNLILKEGNSHPYLTK